VSRMQSSPGTEKPRSRSNLLKLSESPRVTVRRVGAPDSEGDCVVYRMQLAPRGLDNPALAAAVEATNELGKPVVVFFAPLPGIQLAAIFCDADVTVPSKLLGKAQYAAHIIRQACEPRHPAGLETRPSVGPVSQWRGGGKDISGR
jgi:hypothetical protein